MNKGLIFLIAGAVLFIACHQRQIPQQKPSQPLQVDIKSINTQNNIYQLEVTATSEIDVHDMQIEVITPDTVKIISGTPKTQVWCEKGKTYSLKIECQIPTDSFVEVMAVAKIQTPSASFVNSKTLTFNDHLKLQKPRGESKVTSEGEHILEFKQGQR